jgi:hypothetical protein
MILNLCTCAVGGRLPLNGPQKEECGYIQHSTFIDLLVNDMIMDCIAVIRFIYTGKGNWGIDQLYVD